ncbi:MAG TPA: hypothetical protein VGE36_02290 [Roseateles sp.]
MQTEFTPRRPTTTRQAGANTLRIASARLREWAGDGERDHVIQPRPDEAAWEDTEIDVRRTVL